MLRVWHHFQLECSLSLYLEFGFLVSTFTSVNLEFTRTLLRGVSCFQIAIYSYSYLQRLSPVGKLTYVANPVSVKPPTHGFVIYQQFTSVTPRVMWCQAGPMSALRFDPMVTFQLHSRRVKFKLSHVVKSSPVTSHFL